MAQIKNRFTNEVIAEGGTVREAAENNRDTLAGAILNGANLNGAILNGADLDGAILYGASLDGASLDGAKGVVTSGTSPRGYSHWAWIKDGGIVYRAGCRAFAHADEYRAYYASPEYSKAHGPLSAAVSLALCEMNIELAGKLLDQQEAVNA